ncbi:P-loop NTPase fold protein [Acinetobacter baumannii]|uniref:P-loop NTPase fold protein n=1 Tax=Acinetobacter baumannii TaxID=470 RepID=UPI0039FD623D
MKICIVGPSGAGKTTLSKKLEKELNISAYAFDGIYWNLSGTVFIKNSEEIIFMELNKFLFKTSGLSKELTINVYFPYFLNAL